MILLQGVSIGTAALPKRLHTTFSLFTDRREVRKVFRV